MAAMKWIRVRAEFHGRDDDVTAEMVAGVFHDLGIGGVILEDPSLAPAARAKDPAVTGFLPSSVEGRAKSERLQMLLKKTGDRHHIAMRLQLSEIDDEDWAESWKAFFKPVWIFDDMVVKPSWENIPVPPEAIVIDIDPGMAFGTGGHATTVMSLRLLRAYMKKGDAVLDVGTGSGILAIGAAKLGAGLVCAVDADETAVTVAADNLARNSLPRGSSHVVRGHLGTAIRNRFDLIMANLLTDAIVELLDDLARLSRRNNVFICSGIVPRHKARVLTALNHHCFAPLTIATQEGWIAIAARWLDG
jgi:ribosomal protein L11 methyltransferase